MPDARTILVAGTASHVGKSTVAAGLCRLLADRGVAVAPFKAQNMSNNARAVPRASAVAGKQSESAAADDAFGEIGVSQYAQARAARVGPTTDANPVLLKPRGDGESQLVIDGRAVGNVEAGRYYDDHWADARGAALAAHRRLAAAYDVIVAEGAGSIAEINLHHRDLANVETARAADAEILLVADIERGGVFASLVGTLELLPEDLRARVVGAAITKFRGDVSLLDPGLDAFEDRTGVPVLGVLPYDDPGLPEEDSVSLPVEGRRTLVGDDDVPGDRSVTVAVPRLPRISNFTDLEPLAADPGVRIAYVPPSDDLVDADAVVLPGTKNTVDDLLALRAAGFGRALADFRGPIVGLCGGYQLLGERITNAAVEGTGDADAVEALGLLPVVTRFSREKRVEAVEFDLRDVASDHPLAGASGRVSGYEIHMGETRAIGPVALPFARPGADPTAALGAAEGRAVGTYLHGLFENRIAREAFVDAVFAAAGRERPGVEPERASPYDRAAALVEDHLDLRPLGL
ncbi:cobyric acid synthase [Halegenticoccus tardaugens]|uniref:cobyric acid synthase n=1 Tax=Halegenticoccus tardaugens TaxID=2071624 RepID=UPI00100AA740|nr:cobyric acid synthase [Halegenticoccus tardaugens]